MPKIKTTIYIDENLLKTVKIAAIRQDKSVDQLLEDALREHLGLAAVENVWMRSELDADDALSLAYDEVHASREA